MTFSKSVVTVRSSVVHDLKMKIFASFMLITIQWSHWRRKNTRKDLRLRHRTATALLTLSVKIPDLWENSCQGSKLSVLWCFVPSSPRIKIERGLLPFLRAALSLKPGSKPWGSNAATAQQMKKWFCSREPNMSPYDHARSCLKGKQGLHRLLCLQTPGWWEHSYRPLRQGRTPRKRSLSPPLAWTTSLLPGPHLHRSHTKKLSFYIHCY